MWAVAVVWIYWAQQEMGGSLVRRGALEGVDVDSAARLVAAHQTRLARAAAFAGALDAARHAHAFVGALARRRPLAELGAQGPLFPAHPARDRSCRPGPTLALIRACADFPNAVLAAEAIVTDARFETRALGAVVDQNDSPRRHSGPKSLQCDISRLRQVDVEQYQ